MDKNPEQSEIKAYDNKGKRERREQKKTQSEDDNNEGEQELLEIKYFPWKIIERLKDNIEKTSKKEQENKEKKSRKNHKR